MRRPDVDSSSHDTVLVRGRCITVKYGVRRSACVAVDRVDIDVRRGRTLGLVGESGCGKTTLGRALLRLVPMTSGSVEFDGADVGGLRGAALRRLRRRMQMVFQDSSGSLNPRMRVEAIIADPLAAHGLVSGDQRRKQVRDWLMTVGLEASMALRYPHELSGGQRQRVGLARALVLEPDFVVCDEPLSALDIPGQAELLDLLEKLKHAKQASYLFITHNLAIARRFCDEVAVMHLGRIVEIGPASLVLKKPAHPYTAALRDAVPQLKPARRIEWSADAGSVSSPPESRSGCAYRTRCRFATDTCRDDQPILRRQENGEDTHRVACHHAESIGQKPLPSSLEEHSSSQPGDDFGRGS